MKHENAGFEQPSLEAERPKTKQELALGIYHAAIAAHDLLAGLPKLFREGRLTDEDISRAGVQVERLVFREICSLLGIDEETRQQAINDDDEV